MSKINLESISSELAPYGWKVLSEKYKNLDAMMEFECAEGHLVSSSWRKIREHQQCPICNKSSLKKVERASIQKRKNTYRVLALDQASNISGYAIYDNKVLVAYGTFKTAKSDEIARCHAVKEWVISMIENWKPDLIAIEGIQYQQQMGVTTFQTLARLQGILLDLCYELKIDTKICPTNTWRSHCGVRGQSRADKKKSMQLLIQEWYQIDISEDEADACGIGKYAADTTAKQIELESWI